MRPREQVEEVGILTPLDRIEPLAVDQQMQIGIRCQRQTRPRPGAVEQLTPEPIDPRAAGQDRSTWRLRRRIP